MEPKELMMARIKELEDSNKHLESEMNYWKAKYFATHNELRKAHKGISRLSYYKKKNRHIIASIRKEFKKVGDNKMIYSTSKCAKGEVVYGM